jgi:hypothetical protein
MNLMMDSDETPSASGVLCGKDWARIVKLHRNKSPARNEAFFIE